MILHAAHRGPPMGEGGEPQGADGPAVIGGLITSALLTLVHGPVVLNYLDGLAGAASLFPTGRVRRAIKTQVDD
jgi:hypothetical protein